MSAPLLELWSRVGPIIARDFDNLLEVLQIIGGYMLLGRGAFMSLHARDVVSVLDGCLMEVKDRGKVAVADCAALLLEVFPAEGPALLEPLVVRMLQVLLANREEACCCLTIASALDAGDEAFVILPLVDAASMAAALRTCRKPSDSYDPSPEWQNLHLIDDDPKLFRLLHAAKFLDCAPLLERAAECIYLNGAGQYLFGTGE